MPVPRMPQILRHWPTRPPVAAASARRSPNILGQGASKRSCGDCRRDLITSIKEWETTDFRDGCSRQPLAVRLSTSQSYSCHPWPQSSRSITRIRVSERLVHVSLLALSQFRPPGIIRAKFTSFRALHSPAVSAGLKLRPETGRLFRRSRHEQLADWTWGRLAPHGDPVGRCGWAESMCRTTGSSSAIAMPMCCCTR